MLRLRDVKHLGKVLWQHRPEKIEEAVHDPERFYRELLLRDPTGRRKDRIVLEVRNSLRLYQNRLQGFFVRKLKPSPYSHGGVRGRSIKTNASQHSKSSFIFKTDISSFYPSISSHRLYCLFVEEFCCSPDVARLCTRICTYKHHLALGIPTSPILADQLMQDVDRRIGAMCAEAGLVYTRFVDDVAISGPFDLHKSSIHILVERILQENGFRLNSRKHEFGRLGTNGLSITGIRPLKGKLDVEREYLIELHRQLDDARALASGAGFRGPFYTLNQILGRVNFVCWVNPGRARALRRKYRMISRKRHKEAAVQGGYQISKPMLARITSDSLPGNPRIRQSENKST